jgi:sortase (surface protein transpeptidase)
MGTQAKQASWGPRGRRLGRLRELLALGLLVTAALGVVGLGRWVSPALWPNPARTDGRAAAVSRPAVPTPAPSATPDDILQAALAIVAPSKPPTRLKIPAIGVDASVEPVGLDPQGRMAAPSRTDNVGWYNPGTVPGDAGNAVIDGHLDWTTGPAVFWRLGKLRPGDQVFVVHDDGSQARFIADATSMMPFDASTDSLFTKSGPPTLTLITCAGTWDRQRGTYLQRLVVHTSLAPSTATEKPR